MEARTGARTATRYGLTFYDGAYLALAEALDCSLVTADLALVRRASASGRVRLLGAPR